MRILCYHKIQNSSLFSKQIKYLNAHYRILNPETFLSMVEQGLSFSKNDLLITFDDGDISVYTNALPVLKKQNTPAIAFVITSLLNTQQPFWWDEAVHYSGTQETVKQMKRIPEEERIAALEQLRKQSPNEKYMYPQLTTQQLQELEAGGISIACHTHTHPLLDQCSLAQVTDELVTSKNILQKLGFPFFDVFAYPNGNSNRKIEEVVKAAGYKAAFIFDHTIAKEPVNPFAISRLSVTDETPMWKFKLILSGVHSYQLKLRKRLGS